VAGDLPGQTYGDQSHLIDFSTETLDQTGAAGAMVSTAPDLIAFGPALTTLATAICGPAR
jgi:hypothetical protein